MDKIVLGRTLNNEKSAFDIHDLIREGKATELSGLKTAVLLKMMFNKINELVSKINEIEAKSLTLKKNRLK